MDGRFDRTKTLIGDEAFKMLKASRVAVFGIGGVGGYTAEALARCGVGTLDLIDSDRVDITNINRQIYALSSTVGRYKTEVAKERIADINPEATVNEHRVFYLPETADEFNLKDYDYIVDAVDTVTAKIELVVRAKAEGVPIISAMGAGNKISADAFEVADIYETSVCPLSKVMRCELRKRNIDSLKVVYSKEKPILNNGERVPASCSTVPAVMGLIIANEVFRDISKLQEK